MLSKLNFLFKLLPGFFVYISLFSVSAVAAGVPDYQVHLDFKSPSPAAAAAAWKAMEGNPNPQPGREQHLSFLRFPCQLAKEKNDRASWDLAFNPDLSLARGIRFLFRCTDASPVASFFCYFKSGNGWYAIPFKPKANGKWETIEVLKAASGIEGTPGGWSGIDTFRISAWRGNLQNTHFDLAAIGIVHPNVPAAVIRSVSAASELPAGDARGIFRYCANVVEAMENNGLNPAVLDDLDVNRQRLERVKLAILPYNPRLSNILVNLLSQFVNAGGHVVGFYELPEELAAALGIDPGKYSSAKEYSGGLSAIAASEIAPMGFPAQVRQKSWSFFSIQPIAGNSEVWARWRDGDGRLTTSPAVVASSKGAWLSHVYLAQDRQHGERLILAMIAPFLDSTWTIVGAHSLHQITSNLPYPNFKTAVSMLAEETRESDFQRQQLAKAVAAFNNAVRLVPQNSATDVLEQAAIAKGHLEQTYISMQEPVPEKFRALWCHRGFGIDNWSWDKTAKAAADAGFNALLVNMLTAGSSFYPSQLVTEDPRTEKQGDQLQAALAACRRHKLDLHVWKVCYSLRENADRTVLERMREAGRLQRNFTGEEKRWLCPSDPRNMEHEVNTIVEILQRYPVAGIHLDYIRYPGQDSCFCKNCRNRFEKFTGKPVSNWPPRFHGNTDLRQRWHDFRRQNITALVKSIKETINRIRPETELSAAVYGNWLSARESVAQDWVEWCRDGYLDFVCPMNYTSSREEFLTLTKRQQKQLDGIATELYPGIGLSSENLTPVAVIQQMVTAGELGIEGFAVFELSHSTATDILPALRTALK